MTQLEQELTALFEDAASRVEIRPLPMRSARTVALNRVLAAGVTAALVAGVVLIATRLGADGAKRGGAITPAATQQLIDAVARTLAQPIRIDYTIDSGRGAAQTSVTEMDIDRRELVTFHDGQPQLLIIGGRVYEGISSVDHQMFHLPAAAQWIQGPRSGPAVDSMMQSVGGIIHVQDLATAISSGQVTVTEIAPDTYRLAGSQSQPPGSAGTDDETIHVSAEGLFDWARVQASIPTGNGGPVMHLVVNARIHPLGHPIDVVRPDPSTVITQKAYEAATNSGQSCSGGPSPAPSNAPSNGSVYSSEIHCSVDSFTVGAATAGPKKH